MKNVFIEPQYVAATQNFYAMIYKPIFILYNASNDDNDSDDKKRVNAALLFKKFVFSFLFQLLINAGDGFE